MLTTDIENFPGFQAGIAGPKLMLEMEEQAKRFGTKIIHEYVTAVDFSTSLFKIWTNFPESITPDMYQNADEPTFKKYLEQIKTAPAYLTAKTVILATGATSIMVGAKGESEFIGRGVSTCAICDASFFKDKTTFVIGGGDSAMEDSLALTKFAKSVTVVHRRDRFKASKIMQERVLNNPKIKVLWNTTLQEVVGSSKVEKIILNENGQTKEYPADGVFIAIGHKPVTRQFAGEVLTDDKGYVVTAQSPSELGLKMAHERLNREGLVDYPTMTSVEGVFAAGDGVDLRYRQAITASGQGASASIDAERWLESRGE